MAKVAKEDVSIAESVVVLNLEMGKITNRRKLESTSDVIDTEIDRKMLHVSVDLFDSPELRACQKFLTKLRSKVRHYCVPSFFRGGMYLVKLEAFELIDKLLEDREKQFEPLVKKFADVAEKRREESKVRLKSAIPNSAYPTTEEIKLAYRIEWGWFTLSTPESLSSISKAVYEREKKKAEVALNAATENITVMLAAEAKGLSDHLIERLSPAEDGKPKIIRKSVVGNISEFLATFNLRNIGTSDELTAQVSRMKKLIDGVDPESLKNNEQLRVDLAKGFADVTSTLDKMITEKPKRFMAKAEDAA